ncbi:transglutaminase N-terminal domain-containing protein [Methylocucumis oryzae]|uniref:transglutaminase N-terminal domain-containing protein n=1 Tax=Methylocucumis oryzae TaxID=1632867 RepID=UPI000A8E868A|nr:transglutaminase N-terminal domain-containing protein [Methylocucumis oryzae]
MSIKVAIRHKTIYHFDKAVALSPHVFRLRPAVHSRTPIKGYSLRIEPEEHFINWQQDPFGNILARVVFPKKTRLLSVDVEVIADMTTINPFDFFRRKLRRKISF